MKSKSSPTKRLSFSRKQLFTMLAIVLAFGAIGTYFVVRSNATTCLSSVWQYGSSGSCVYYIQTMVNYHSPAGLAISVDGQFGPQTRGSITGGGVKYVQFGYQLTTDGIVGPHTWYVLCNKQPNPHTHTSLLNYNYAAKAAGCYAKYGQ